MNKTSWTLLIILAMVVGVFLVGCGTRNDGMDDLWIGVKHVEQNRGNIVN